MDEGQDQDQYEEQLKELFNTFDGSGSGWLSPEELSDLCQSLHLDDAAPTLLHTLLHNQDRLTARVDFDQFKDALILVLSSGIEPPPAEEEEETLQESESPEIQPKFVKGSKRYGRRSTPELTEPISDLCEVPGANDDSAVPRKRERWNASTEEYEAEGQMHLWNPDEPSAPRKPSAPLPGGVEERLREACEELNVAWDRCAAHTELLSVCQHLGLEMTEDFLLSVAGDDAMNIQDFVSRFLNHNKLPTPSASTPYRQLKRHHSTQPFDEGGRRFTTPSGLTSTIGMRLFSTLDDGTGFTPAEHILDAWVDEGIENSTEILQALNFDLDNKLSLTDLTLALENELLVTKNGIHQAALASFKAEIRHLLERIDREVREKEKIRSDLDKAERLQSRLATEVDEHHSAIEHTNTLKIRRLEQEHREKVTAVRSELMKEMDLMQQQASVQREELEAEVEKIREDETFLRDHLSISVKENRRLEMELLDSTEKLVDTETQVTKLQTHLDNVMKEKFGDLDPGSAEFFLTEERIRQMRSGYEAQCRELQDRIDELQSELQEFHGLGRVHQPCNKPLSEELESKSPGMESDPGIGSEEVQPFSMSLEVEMMLEQLKEQHLQEMEELRNQLDSKIKEIDEMADMQVETPDDQSSILALQLQQEVQDVREELTRVQSQAQELQSQLEQAELDRQSLERRRAEEREELENLQEDEVGSLRRQLLEVRTCTADLEEQLKHLEAERREAGGARRADLEALRERHAAEMEKLKEELAEASEVRLEEEKKKLQAERDELEERRREELRELHEADVREKVEEARARSAEEQDRAAQRLGEQWQSERARLDEQNNQALQLLLEEEMLRLVKEQEEKDGKLREEWEEERAGLLALHQANVLEERARSEQREAKLREEWERERLQLEEDYEGMVEERLSEEREKMEAEREEEEKRMGNLMEEDRALLEERQREVVKELQAKHGEEREEMSTLLDKLRDDFAQERREIQISFTRRIKDVEERFTGDQQSIEERFQADVLKLEQHYQRHLQDINESHEEEKLRWEAQMQEATENAEEQRRTTEEEMEQERAGLIQEWTAERCELERFHQEQVEELKISYGNLQNQLEELSSSAQTKEIELSRQLNELHNRLQESLETKDQLLAQSESGALQAEQLLSQTVEDFKMERAELEENQSELQAKYREMMEMSEAQVAERIGLITERDDLRMKIEELELLLKQAAEDFELDRKEMEEKLHTNVEGDREAERERLVDRIKELEKELDDASREEVREQRDLIAVTEEEIQIVSLDYDEDEEENMLEVKMNGDDDSPGNTINNNNKESVSAASWPEEFGDEDADCASCEVDGRPQDSDSGSFSHEEERGREDVVTPAGTGDPDELNLEDAEVVYSPNAHHRRERDAEWGSGEIKDDCVGRWDEESCRENQDDSPENVLLQERISLLQQKTEILESLLAHSSEKVRASQQVLEENYSLKVKMVLLMEHVKGLEAKALKMADVQIRYEDCLCENAKLKEQNCELERTAWSLETRMNMFHDFQDEQLALMDEVTRTRAENARLLAMLREQERQRVASAEDSPERPEVQVASDLEGSCHQFEKQNSELRRAVAELHDESLTLNESTLANRSEACRLAEENLLLRQKIAALKEEDLKQAQEELTRTLEHLRNEKGAAQNSTETFQKQIGELRSQSQRFQSENTILRQQLAELMKEKEKREGDKDELAACVSSLEAELKKALSDSAQLEERNAELLEQLSDLRVKRIKLDSMENQLSSLLQDRRNEDVENQGLRNQLAKAQEKVKTMDESCQAVNHQSARLKADVRVAQKERDSLKHDVSILHKQLQNAKDKNHVLEKALRSTGLQSPSRRLHREEMSRVLEQEQHLLRQENERLQAEVRSVKLDLAQSRDKVRQLDAAMKQHRQHSPTALLRALEQENAALKQKLEARREKSKDCEAGQGQAELESLQQENEALKAQMARLSTQLMESFQAHLVGLLPPSPHRTPRGHRGEDGDNMQNDRERKMKHMEERMREVELSLHNVKLLLKEKMAQLKDQLCKNSKADVLIQDLYVENEQLLKALDLTEQRHKISEKKNYLLEEKISSLNKIVRDLNPSPLPSVPYHYK